MSVLVHIKCTSVKIHAREKDSENHFFSSPFSFTLHRNQTVTNKKEPGPSNIRSTQIFHLFWIFGMFLYFKKTPDFVCSLLDINIYHILKASVVPQSHEWHSNIDLSGIYVFYSIFEGKCRTRLCLGKYMYFRVQVEKPERRYVKNSISYLLGATVKR